MFGYTIPDKGEGLNDAQSVLFQQCLEVLADSFQNFVQSGCGVTPQGAPNMTVQVAAGTVYSVTSRLVTAGNAALAISAADATNPRFDYIVITTGAVAAVRQGTPSAAPKPINLTAGDVCVALVYVPAAATSITTANIFSRAIVAPRLAGEVLELPVLPANISGRANAATMFARKLVGRDIHLIENLDGAPRAIQTALAQDDFILVTPNNTAIQTIGGNSTSGGTGAIVGAVNTNDGTRLVKTRFANVVTTTNQLLGVRATGAADLKFTRGDVAGKGGFYFSSRFSIELIAATTIRLAVGLWSSAAAASAADTITGDGVMLWHDTTDALNVLSIITRDNVTSTKTAIAGVPNLTAGLTLGFELYCAPNGTTIFYRLWNFTTGALIAEGSVTATLPRNTVFMGHQCNMSNGTVNITVTTVALGVNNVFCTAVV
jgi:hypothetical protein